MSLFSAFFTPHGKKPLYLKDLFLGYKKHVIRGAGMAGEYTGSTVVGGIKGFGAGLKKGAFPTKDKDPWAFMKQGLTGGAPVVQVTIPDIPKIPEFPKFPEFPKITLPTLPEGGLIQVGKLPDISMGADILGGVGMPSFSLKDEEGDVNPLMLAALAIGGFYVIKKVA